LQAIANLKNCNQPWVSCTFAFGSMLMEEIFRCSFSQFWPTQTVSDQLVQGMERFKARTEFLVGFFD
jgi:hypothetical protein